jgi:hypothetical protein
MKFNSFEHRHSLGGRAMPCLGGDSSSNSSSTQNTNYTLNDSRSVSDSRDYSNSGNTTTNTFTGGVGNGVGNTTTNSGNTTTTTSVTMTDQGAVAAGKAVAIAGMAQNSTNYDSLLAVADNLFAQTKKTTDANLTLAGSLSGGAQKAYADATSQATGNKTVILLAIAAVAIVAFAAMRKH